MPSSFSTKGLLAALMRIPAERVGAYCVAFSGGLDSTALLAALAELRGERPDWKLRAIHIDHQLHESSHEWATQCERVAQGLGIELTVRRVVVAHDDAQGLEAAARRSRYAAFRELLLENEMLLTAHHADDQTETVLLALLRGAGIPGLAAMPEIKKLGRGWHARPLLHFTRAELDEWARAREINSVSDPSNALLRHDRNYLRHEIVPKLRGRWPALAANAGRSAKHIGEASGLLDELADADLQICAVAHCLRIDDLKNLSPPRRRNLLRFWLRSRGLPAPSTRKLAGLVLDLFNTDLDRIPCVTWQGAEVRWYRGLLYADAARESLGEPREFEQDWEWKAACKLPASLGSLSMRATLTQGLSAARLPEHLTIRFRRGGEKIQLAGRQHRSALRNLLQENAVLPWWRDRLPLIYAERKLLAVGDLILSDEFAASAGEPALCVEWSGAPAWRAVEHSPVDPSPADPSLIDK